MEARIERGRIALPMKIALAAASALALAFGAVAPAMAADHTLGAGDIIGFEDGREGTAGYNYDQWHVGLSVTTDPTWAGKPVSDSLAFNQCSVTTLAHPNAAGGSHTQVLKGYPIVARPTSTPADTTAIAAVLNSISLDVASAGVASIQVPMFLYPAGGGAPLFTTVRSANLTAAGSYTLAGQPLTDSQSRFAATDLTSLLAELAGSGATYSGFEILGVGFTGSTGTQVGSVSFGGDNYFFGGVCPSVGAPTPPSSVQTAAK